MDKEQLIAFERAYKDSGERGYKKLAEYLNMISIGSSYGIPGFIAYRKQMIFYGVSHYFSYNQDDEGCEFRDKEEAFTGYHECGHVFLRHYKLPEFLDENGFHKDMSFDLHSRKVIKRTEDDVNLLSAHIIVETDQAVELLGCDNQSMKAFRHRQEIFDEKVKEYTRACENTRYGYSSDKCIKKLQAMKNQLDDYHDELLEEFLDLQNDGYFLTAEEMARTCQVPTYIFEYKIADLKILGMDVPEVDLRSFEKMFERWRA